jgi:maleate isomerase
MKRVLLGMLTPSSNTSLEPLVSAMVADIPGVSAHFGRFRVTEISLKDTALGQFDQTPIMDAAKLLADAKVDVICWNGTSSGWLGFGSDEALCRTITAETGIPACTSVLALNDILARTGARSLGFATPYIDGIQRRIVENYRKAGFDPVVEAHLGLSVNWDFSEVTREQIHAMVASCAKAQPAAITTFCTNLRAADYVPELEREFGIPVYDTVSTAVWQSLRIAGVDTRQLARWGRLFAEVV